MTRKQKKLLRRIIIAAVLFVALFFVPDSLPAGLRLGLYFVPYLIIGYKVLWTAVRNIRAGQVFDENFLMAVATLGAFGCGEYPEAVAVMLFYQVGELFENIAVGRSRKSISDLMDIRPDYANIERDGELIQVDPEEVHIGDTIVVKAGEKIPLDGVVTAGESAVDTAALTGESLPRDVLPGSEVISGCVNLSGLLRIEVKKEFGESTVSKILELVENSSSKKAKAENFITKFARYYTPVVVFAALALAVIPSLITGAWNVWVLRGLTFLVVSCPCALVISIPLSFFGGIGGASKKGILVKGGNYLEALASAGIVVFDKTGTLTQGVFEVSGVHHPQIAKEKILEYAALAECASSHPISKSLQKAYGKEVDRSRVSDIEEIGGEGVKAVVDGVPVAAGNGKLMRRMGLEAPECRSVGTIVHVAVDGSYVGHIVISDIEKPTAKEAIEKLKKSGVTKTVMLTGDARRVAEQVAGDLGVDEVHSELLPGDKVDEVEKLLARKGKKEVLAFVGDGVNDAPVLSRADIGIAMGAMGSDAAIEAADVVLMDDDPLKIAKAIRISRKCIGIVYQNITFALVVKFTCLLLTALGYAKMGAAIFADVGVMVLAVLNAIRALRVHNL